MVNFHEVRAETVLNPDFVDSYSEQINFFHSEIVKLNTNLYILKKIQAFPFILIDRPDRIFWSTIQGNLLENIIISINRVYIDKGKDVITLLKLKDQIMQNIKQEYKADFQGLLKFDKKSIKVLETIKSLRTSRLAHLIGEEILNGEVKSINFSEIEQIISQITDLYRILCFDVNRTALPIQYSDEGKTTDIEFLLDAAGSKSKYILMPEERPFIWDAMKKTQLNPIAIAKINEYRKKENLPEV